MNGKKLFTVETTIETKDYRRFLYLTTFLKSRATIILMLLATALAALFLAFYDHYFYPLMFILYWIILLLAAVLVIVFKVERKVKQKITTDRTGTFGAKETLDFYRDFVTLKSTAVEGETRIKYSQFYRILESRDFFITYFDANLASLIRKKDLGGKTTEELRALYKKKMGRNYRKILG